MNGSPLPVCAASANGPTAQQRLCRRLICGRSACSLLLLQCLSADPGRRITPSFQNIRCQLKAAAPTHSGPNCQPQTFAARRFYREPAALRLPLAIEYLTREGLGRVWLNPSPFAVASEPNIFGNLHMLTNNNYSQGYTSLRSNGACAYSRRTIPGRYGL